MLKLKYQQIYGKLALTLGSVSQCQRLKVGAFILEIVDGIPCVIGDGVNGLRSGSSNCCEDNEGRTVDEVRHAEDAAITKLYIRSGLDSVKGKVMVVSDSPCHDCAQKIVDSGITDVYYVRDYRKTEGLDLLREAGLNVEKIVGLDPLEVVVNKSGVQKGWHSALRKTIQNLNTLKLKE